MLKGRNPTKKEAEHMEAVSELGCIVCLNTTGVKVPAEIHHVIGKTKPNAHFSVLPLCFEHHRKGNRFRPISRHPYKKRFEDAYGTEEELLKQVNKMVGAE